VGRRIDSPKGSIRNVLLLGGALIPIVGILLFFLLLQGTPSGKTKDVLIPKGLSLRAVTDVLHQEGIVQRPLLFRLLLRVTRGNKNVRAGEFKFSLGANLLHTLKTLYYSEPVTHPLTIPEGWNIKQIADLIGQQQLGDSKKFAALALSQKSAERYHLQAPHLEGFLYPDTYLISRLDSEEKILEQMVNRFFQELNSRFKDKIQKSGMTLERVVTLASIVEKETGNPQERPLIASVFSNRLKKGMRLQSDPTTIYGIDNFNGNLTKADLQRMTPYNTYTIPALPPGPIASPGGDAIEAVLNPAQTDYLFFVSNNNGSHLFSKTYAEHTRFVKNFQINRNRQKGNP